MFSTIYFVLPTHNLQPVLHQLKYSFLSLIISLFSLLGVSGCHEVTVIIKGIPTNTPAGAVIFVSGNFNYWDPGDQKFALQRNEDSTYSITLPRGMGNVEYKFTRGDWTTVEQDACGHDVMNRELYYGDADTIVAKILSWKDLGPTNCKNVTFVLKQAPRGTPQNANIHIVGNFNNWDPSNKEYIMQKNHDGSYSINLPENVGRISYKFTLGDWASEEVDENGFPIENREFTYGNADTVFVDIASWKNVTATDAARVTFLVRAPKTTPPNDPIYLVGSFNDWYPRDEKLLLTKLPNGYYTFTLSRRGEDYIEYKFTRGGWETGESDTQGVDSPNRNFTFGTKDTVYVQIAGWVDKSSWERKHKMFDF